jgi:hypothetical protein
VDEIVQTETDRRTATISPLTATEPADIDAKTRGALDGSAAAFGFGPGMFNTLAANPTVLEIVMGLQESIAKLLDAKTRHTVDLAVSQSNAFQHAQALHGYISSNLGGTSSEAIEIARKPIDRAGPEACSRG